MLPNEEREEVNSIDSDSEELEPITNLEESVVRMRHGIKNKPNKEQKPAAYEKRPVSDAVYRKLLEIELRALEKTGRLVPMLKKHKSKKTDS